MFQQGRGDRRNASVFVLASALCSGRAGGGIFWKLDRKPAAHPPPVQDDPPAPCSIFFTTENRMSQGSHATNMALDVVRENSTASTIDRMMFHRWNTEISSAENGLDGITWESEIVHANSKILLYFPSTIRGFVGIRGTFFVWLGYCFCSIARILNNYIDIRGKGRRCV